MRRAIRGNNVTSAFHDQLRIMTLGQFKRWNRLGAVPNNLDEIECATGGNGLHYAVRNRKHSLVRHLILDCGMNPDISVTDNSHIVDVTPLHYAIYRGDIRMVCFLLDQAGCNVHATIGRFNVFPKGANALDIALHAPTRNYRRIYQLLQDAGAYHTCMKNLRFF